MPSRSNWGEELELQRSSFQTQSSTALGSISKCSQEEVQLMKCMLSSLGVQEVDQGNLAPSACGLLVEEHLATSQQKEVF